jgi:hypothetical protein
MIWDGIIDISSINFIDTDRDLNEFKEWEFVEVFLDDSSDDISQKIYFFIGDVFFASHSFQDEVNLIESEWLRLDLSVFVL